MENISMLLAFVIFPFFISGYITFESWRAPQKYHDQMKALYGEDSWYTQWMTSRYVILIYRVVALIILPCSCVDYFSCNILINNLFSICMAF